MGALCGKEDHFDSLGSQGNKLGSSSAPLARTPTPHEPRRKPPVAVGSAGRKLGGSGEGGGGGTNGGPDREAMLRAAEQRSKASESRGLKSEGKLARQLAEQKKDGGRAEQARLEAEQRGERLVWD
ncbi:hypothetical protein JCM5353_005128 [Sporobolomyces roseus]